MKTNSIVANNLKILRTTRGMNQTQAGNMIGVSQQTWARYEKGEVDITADMLGDIAQAFEIADIGIFFKPSAFEYDLPSPTPHRGVNRDELQAEYKTSKKARTARRGEKQGASM